MEMVVSSAVLPSVPKSVTRIPDGFAVNEIFESAHILAGSVVEVILRAIMVSLKAIPVVRPWP